MFQKLLIALAFAHCTIIVMAQTDSVTSSKKELQELLISGIRPNLQAPITQLTLKKADIEQKYYGADVPTLISTTPSINSYSDNGTGIGYSYFRLRGMDQSRVNHSINGIPLNDPENQGVYFNNIADLSSSAESIQIQRGVGVTGNGTAAYAGSIAILTKNLTPTEGASVNLGAGSFGSTRATIEYQSGLIGKMAFYGRLSNVQTAGYREHSGASIFGYQFSTGYFGKKGLLRFNAFGGSAQSHLAYNGIDIQTLNENRKANPNVNDERDAFRQNFFQLQYSKTVWSGFSYNASAYLVLGTAPRFDYYFPTVSYNYLNLPNVVRGGDTLSLTDATGSYRLNQVFYGAFANVNYQKGRFDWVGGLHASSFICDHFMEIRSITAPPLGYDANHQVYFNTGKKQEASVFVRSTYHASSKVSLFADAQLRSVAFQYQAKEMEIRKDNLNTVEPMNWLFFNPKVGARYQLNAQTNFYGMFGYMHREPTRFDYLNDDLANTPVQQKDVKPEIVKDVELGGSYTSSTLALNANLFYMDFVNQIASTGILNQYGSPINTNVGASYRRGIEIDVVFKLSKKFSLIHASSFSENRIKSINLRYLQVALDTTIQVAPDTILTKSNVTSALSPSIILNQGIRFTANKWFYAEINYRYVGMQYLDNSNDKNLTAPAFQFLDAKAVISLERWVKFGKPRVTLLCNNITNEKYVTAGTVAPYSNVFNVSANGSRENTSQALFFPAATRNFFVTISWKF